jgi:TPR repeat protein
MTSVRLLIGVSSIAFLGNAQQVSADNLDAVKAKAVAGDSSAQDALGQAYRNGEVVARNYGEAIHWFRLAADQGLAKGQADLALMYDSGWGVPEDPVEAVRLWVGAAERGDLSSKMALWIHYDHGIGVPQNSVEAFRWCRSLADQIETPADVRTLAQQGLGDDYRLGKGIPQDYQQSEHWYALAADRGDARSQYYLGLLLSQGLGVRQDYVAAHKWLNLAAARSYQNAATARDQVARFMSPIQIKKAQTLARDWRPAP